MSELTVQGRVGAGAFGIDVELVAKPGVTVLFGPSASGKTLTLRAIAGLDRITGSIRWDETILDDKRSFVPAFERHVGYTPQDGSLWPHRTVREHLLPFCDAVRASELLAMVSLSNEASHEPARLSGGQKQRLAFVRAIARRPRLLLLDEPFSALDDDARIAMGERVREEAKRGAVVLFVTHHKEEADRLADQFVVYDAGRAISRLRRVE